MLRRIEPLLPERVATHLKKANQTKQEKDHKARGVMYWCIKVFLAREQTNILVGSGYHQIKPIRHHCWYASNQACSSTSVGFVFVFSQEASNIPKNLRTIQKSLMVQRPRSITSFLLLGLRED